MSDDALVQALKADPVPLLRDILASFGAIQASKVVKGLKGSHRLRLAQAWFPWEGMAPATLVDADRALQRLLEAGSPPSRVVLPKKRRRRAKPSPLRSIAQELASAEKGQAAQRMPSRSLLLQQRIHNAEVAGVEPEYLWEFPSFAQFHTEVMALPAEWVKRAGALCGLAPNTAAALRAELVTRGGEGLAKLVRTGAEQNDSGQRQLRLAAAASQHGGGTEKNLGQRPPYKPPSAATASPGQVLLARGELSDEESDDSYAAGDMVRRQLPERRSFITRPGAGSASAGTGAAPVLLTNATIRLSEGQTRPDAERTLGMLREASQTDGFGVTVERLCQAIVEHCQGEPLARLPLRTGKFYAAIHKAASVPEEVRKWSGRKASFAFGPAGSIHSDQAVARLVDNVEILDEHLMITLDADMCARLASAPGVCGFAELGSGAGATAAHSLWQPLREWTGDHAQGESVKEELQHRITKVVSDAAEEADKCDARGIRRLLGLVFLTVISSQSLIKAARALHPAWNSVAHSWLRELQQEARLGLLISQTAQNAASIAAFSAAQMGKAAGGGQRQREPTPITKQARGPSQHRGPESRQGDRFKDDPACFVWCAVCAAASHCTSQCSKLGAALRTRVKGGTSAQAAADKIIQDTEQKYESKGRAFAQAFKHRVKLDRAALLLALDT